MANDKFGENGSGRRPDNGEGAVRARNRTVMLTPEITGQVRARLSREPESLEGSAPAFGLPAPENDFVSPLTRGFDSGASVASEEIDFSGASDIETALPGFSVEPYEPAVLQENLSNSTGVNPIAREVFHMSAGPAQRPAARTEDSVHLEYVPVKEGALLRREPTPPAVEPEPRHVRNRSATEKVGNVDSVKSRDNISRSKLTPVVGFLVSFDEDVNGEVFYLRQGRIIVTSESSGKSDVLFLDHETVSPTHAALKITADGEMHVLDNLSEHGTTITRPETEEEITLSGDKAIVQHKDLIAFGKRTFRVCLL